MAGAGLGGFSADKDEAKVGLLFVQILTLSVCDKTQYLECSTSAIWHPLAFEAVLFKLIFSLITNYYIIKG